MNQKNYRQAVAEALAQEMLRNPYVSIKGDDVINSDEFEGEKEAASNTLLHHTHLVTSARGAIFKSLLFLVCTGFVALVLYREVGNAFMTNPGLNGLVLAVLLFAVISVFTALFRLNGSIRWLNRALGSEPSARSAPCPDLIVPLEKLISRRAGSATVSASAAKTLLELTLARLEDDQRVQRDLVIVLLFLGLFGAAWGGAVAMSEVGYAIQTMGVSSADARIDLEFLKAALQAPISGLNMAFSATLFALGSALIVFVLHLSSGRALTRFRRELEDWLVLATEFHVARRTKGGS